MASPKHLWSGDWERESNDRPPLPDPEPAPPTYRVAPEPEPEPDAEPPQDGQPDRRRLIFGAAALVVVVIVAVVLAVTLGSSKTKTPAQTPQAQVQPTIPPSGGTGIQTLTTPTLTTPQQTAPAGNTGQAQANVAAGPTYEWLGMSINLTSDGITVGTVAPGSTADVAGINPGDVLEAVNTSQITSVSALTNAVKGLKIGQRFQLIVNRGSTPVTITATLTGRVTKQ